MAVLTEIVFDCLQPAALARFWAELLDGFEIRPYDDEEVARLASLGLTPETDPCVMVDGPGLHIGFQLTDTQTPPKNKVHLDVRTTARANLVERVCESGATVVDEFDDHTWLRDPEGNDFCITDA